MAALPKGRADIAFSIAVRVNGTASERGWLDSAIGDLLEAVGRVLAEDSASLPEEVNQAAARVARQVEASRRHRSGVAHPVPFRSSIRLGRMR